MIDPKLAPAMINPNADFAVSTFIEEFTNAQKRDTQMLPNDSIAQYDIQPDIYSRRVDSEEVFRPV